MLLVRGGKSGYQMSNVKVSVAQMERGVSRGKREVCPSDQATRRAWGNWLTLACLGESRGDSPPASLADNDLPSLYGGPGCLILAR